MESEKYEVPERRKDYPIIYEKLLDLESHLKGEQNKWSFFGYTFKDISKTVFYLIVAAWWGAGFYNKIDGYENDTKHLLECNKNRDQWATAKYGHPFDCGRPTDGWIYNNKGDVNK